MNSFYESSGISRIAVALAAAALLVFCPSAQAARSIDRSVIGEWRLTAVLDSSEISALDDKQALSLVGQTLFIDHDRIRLGARVCLSPTFEVTRSETSEYFERRAHASADMLGLPNPVTAIHVACTYVYKKASDKLVVHWKGVFFDAVRKPAKHRAKGT